MDTKRLVEHAATYLHQLCVAIGNRRTGSDGNQAATDFFAETAATFGWVVEQPTFDCLDWRHEGADLTASGVTFEVFPSPYSLGCQVQAQLAIASTIEELARIDAAGKLLLMQGELTARQLMPKNFPFYNPEEVHRRIYQLLEEKRPAAVLTATGRDEMTVGSAYPFPVFEDGDFAIPTVYMTDVEGERLAAFEDQELALDSRSWRIQATGANVVATKQGDSGRRLVVTAHIDSRDGTPGANDNASGTIVLLLLTEMLAEYDNDLTIELVAFNGEDYYAASGEKLYLAMNRDRLGDIMLNINIDDVGYFKGKVHFSFYGVDESTTGLTRRCLSEYSVLAEGPAWYQGDHMVFVRNQVPAVALTDELAYELLATITHTVDDTPDIVDPAKLVQVAAALADLLGRFK